MPAPSLLVVLPERRRRACSAQRGGGHPELEARQLHVARGRVIELLEEGPLPQVPALHEVPRIKDRAARHAVLHEDLEQFLLGVLAEPRLDVRVRLVAILVRHREAVAELPLFRPLRLAHRLHEPQPLLDLRSVEEDVTILCSATPGSGSEVAFVAARGWPRVESPPRTPVGESAGSAAPERCGSPGTGSVRSRPAAPELPVDRSSARSSW